MFNRRNFNDEQMQRESGGRQLDAQGRPLVGRYRSGRTPPPGQEAYGAGQMQIRTARNTAQAHGIQWDQRRFLNDREYNLNLADRHMGDLIRHYGGDRVLAQAAYHSGQPNVDRAIRRYGRENFDRGLGPEGRAYVAAARGQGRSRGGSNVPNEVPGGDLPPRTDVTQIRPTETETRQMSQGNRFEIRDPFESGEEIAIEGQEVEERVDQLDDTLTEVIGRFQDIQDYRTEALSTTVDAKTAVNDEMRTQTQELIARARPIFQRREAIAQRQSEMASMNPVERAIRGTFDPNYNEVDLRGRDRAYANELEVLGGQYQYITNLQDTLTRLIQTDYDNQNQLWTLESENMTQDIALLTQSVGVSQTALASTIGDLDNQMGVLRAQATARADTLSQMTIAQVNVALEQAQASEEGYATVNGVPISIAELTQVQRNFQEQQDALESRGMAIEGQRIDLAGRYEDRLISHMTPAQIEEAIRNGGQYQGQQLDVAKLTTAYGNLRARQQQQVEDIANNSAPGVMRNLIGNVGNSYNATVQRMIGMFGSVPDEQRQAMSTATAEIQAIREGFRQAEAQGVGAQYARQHLPRLQALLQQQNTVITGVARRWAGGNRDLQAVGEAWLRGQPLSGDAAVRGLIHMARNGIPAGTRLTGPAAQAFQRVQQLVRESDTPPAGTSMEQLLQRQGNQGREQRERQLMQRVQGAIRGAYNDRLMDEVVAATPRLASRVQVNGRPHPFTRVRQEDYQNAVAHGDQEGYTRLGTELGLNADQTRQLFSEGPNSRLWQQVRQRKSLQDGDFNRLAQRLTAMQTIAMMQALDASPSATTNFRPSQAYANLVNNPQFQQIVGQTIQNSGNSSFGSYLTSTVAGPGFNDAYRSYAQGTQQAYTTLRANTTRQQIQDSNAITRDPWRRADWTLSSVDGLSQQDRRRLLDTIRPMIPRDAAPDEMYQAIRNVILNNRLNDPAIERVRARAASGWAPAERAITGIAGSITNGGY